VRDYSRLASTAFGRREAAVAALVVGAGALGNEVIKNLALIGVESLLIADRDHVEASNLTRSILFCTSDIEHEIAQRTPKAMFAARRVREINPDVAVTAFVGEIADLGYGVIRRADMVFSCLDNEMARLELGWACSRLQKPLVDGGLGLMNYSSGQVTLFPGRGGPCYACRKGAERRRQLLQELQGREDPCWRKEDAIEAAEGVATTPLMASVVAAIQVELGLRALQTEVTDGIGRSYRITLHPTPSLEPSVFERSPSCPLHDPVSLVRTVRECPDGRSDSWTLTDLLRETANLDGSLALDWPMTAKARCRSCGQEWEPLVRRARFRRQRCVACGGADLVEIEVLSCLQASSPWAGHTLAALGLPSGHVHEIAHDDDPDAERVHVEMTGDLPPARREQRC
jgi:adenylyltransferase/sulfurtransferase